MNISSISKYIGVTISLFIIWLINDFILVEACLEQGGKFEYRTGTCLLENNEVYKSGLEMPLIVLYVFIGFLVTFFTSRMISRFFK